MNDIQEVFNRIRDTKQKARKIRKIYKDTLTSNQEYQNIIEKMETLSARKKQIEIETKDQADFSKLDAYKMHIKHDQEMLSDLSLNALISGETVEVVDENNQKYNPLFNVNFKKA